MPGSGLTLRIKNGFYKERVITQLGVWGHHVAFYPSLLRVFAHGPEARLHDCCVENSTLIKRARSVSRIRRNVFFPSIILCGAG